jgi:tRNA-specific 2-thiouridylase
MLRRRFLHVVVGLSGGVDSSVAAYLLQRQGHTVKGLFVTSWDSVEEHGECTGEEDWRDVQRVCHVLGISCERKSFVSEYWMDVFEPLLSGYSKGETPNPDVRCNSKLKFRDMRNFVFASMGADRFATGHYAQLDRDATTGKMRLLQSPCDKDQTLFLSQVSGSQFEKCLFPVGHLDKEKVRSIAREAGLPNAEKKSSTGICFVGKRKFGEWIGDYVDLTAGRFIDPHGNVLGSHNGAERFTLGQRARVGGESRRWFVSNKTQSGDVVLSPQRAVTRHLRTRDTLWVAEQPPDEGHMMVDCRFRHTQPLQRAKMTVLGNDFCLDFEHDQAGVAPGQVVAVYQGQVCLGGGVIAS